MNRAKSSVIDVSCLVLDYDDGTTLKEAHRQWGNWPHLLHTSWSHTPGHHKCRVVVPLAEPVTAAGWARVFHWAVSRAPGIDRQCCDPSRIYFVPSHPDGAEGEWAKAWSAFDGDMLRLDPATLPPTPAEVARAEVKRRPPMRLGAGQGKHAAARAVNELLKTCESARRMAAEHLGATVSDSGRADFIVCPSCDRPSVWFFLTPGAQAQAKCSHKNSCNWHGWIDQLMEPR